MSDDRFLWVDIETTGLVPKDELLLEVGFLITSSDLETVHAEFSVPIWDDGYDEKLEFMSGSPGAQYVLDMHNQSGLWLEAKASGLPLHEAEVAVTDWLADQGVSEKVPMKQRDPLAGSSVHFDREMLKWHLPAVEAAFHYRNIDISTVKELCRRLNPEVYAKLDEVTVKRELHRVIPDLEDTVGEFAFYRDNFLFATV